jgi:cobalt-precorrin-5B (C1)-methyltransferase
VKKKLRSGYTTGACAAAAAKGAALMLSNQAVASEVSIDLPTGDSALFVLHGQSFSTDEASCFVIKDAGDDPDVTNGVEVWGRITSTPFDSAQGTMLITGGIGIGRVTKPGLAIPPGEWAINPVPRRMIEEAVRSVFSPFTLHPSPFDFAQGKPFTLHIEISIPDGEERAKKTLNARLGIIGGLSILGTTGVVRPISAKAWTDTIDAALDVARACGCETVVLSTGRSSEMAAQKKFTLHPSPLTLPEEAYIMMGDHVAYALQACAKRGFNQPILACQFAKLLKIACGYENTHAAASELDLAVLFKWAEAVPVSTEFLAIISNANTAREIAVATGFDRALMELVANRATEAAAAHAPGVRAHPLLCGYDGTVVV